MLPSTRLLAKDLGIARNTVIAAYDQLALEGYLLMRRGSPPEVLELPTNTVLANKAKPQAAGKISARGELMLVQPYHHGSPESVAFHPGLPDAGQFPFNTWSKLLARRAKLARHVLFGTYHITGYPPLCDAIARYLSASRGIHCSAEQIIITNGAQSAFDLLARLLIDPGDTVWMEEPGYYGARAAFVCAGGRLSPLHVGHGGWRLDPPSERPRLIFVTPSCHHPLGITMPLEQRLNLLAMAERWNSWIIEDDYDSEYRFQGHPIPALQGISGSTRVMFVGTFAKILFPAMRLGFMVVPEAIRDRINAALSVTGQFAPLITQAALADFINEGHLTRHLRRMRRLYAGRRQLFISACEDQLGKWLKLNRCDAGIQMVGTFNRPMNDRAVAAAAARRGVNVSPLSMQFRRPTAPGGLLMGFSAADEKALLKGMAGLRRAFLDVTS